MGPEGGGGTGETPPPPTVGGSESEGDSEPFALERSLRCRRRVSLRFEGAEVSPYGVHCGCVPEPVLEFGLELVWGECGVVVE
jgi:hypothetical protein